MRFQGKITVWKDEQGYGFVTPNGGGAPVFLHIKAFEPHQPRPLGNEIVSFEITRDGQDRIRAEAVRFMCAREQRRSAAKNASMRWPLLLVGIFFVFLALSAIGGKLPAVLLALYVGASLLAFISYAADKKAARDGGWRTQESTLHLLALVGGWPGALLAQHRLRHKSAKASFQIVFWATVLLNCGSLGFFLTSAGSRALHTLLGT
jgi:uncharacterized membrane protein YsdA (DUF1294 family)/cold shock CspA family protein